MEKKKKRMRTKIKHLLKLELKKLKKKHTHTQHVLKPMCNLHMGIFVLHPLETMGQVRSGLGAWQSDLTSTERQRSQTKHSTNFTNLKQQIYEQTHKSKEYNQKQRDDSKSELA